MVAQPVALLPQEVGGGEDEETVLGGHRLRLVRRRGRLPLVSELLLLIVFLFTWHLQANNINLKVFHKCKSEVLVVGKTPGSSLRHNPLLDTRRTHPRSRHILQPWHKIHILNKNYILIVANKKVKP